MRFLSFVLCTCAVMATTLPAAAADTYAIDVPGRHYYVGFQISHLGFSVMHGRFDDVDGTVIYDSADPAASSVKVVAQTASINTNHAKRDAHLQSPDFFNAQEFPEITFVSTKIEPGADGTAKITGDLTMAGVTQSITLDANLIKVGEHPFKKTPMAAWSARGTIKRSDFGISYGLPATGDDVTLLIDFEAFKQ